MRKLSQDEIVAALIRLKHHTNSLLFNNSGVMEFSETLFNKVIEVAKGEVEI